MQVICGRDGEPCYQDIVKQMATRVFMTPLQTNTRGLYSILIKEKSGDFKESF